MFLAAILLRYPDEFPSGYRDFSDIEVRISRFDCICKMV
jgi:hypothetical protein